MRLKNSVPLGQCQYVDSVTGLRCQNEGLTLCPSHRAKRKKEAEMAALGLVKCKGLSRRNKPCMYHQGECPRHDKDGMLRKETRLENL